jgi:hypothetical protein
VPDEKWGEVPKALVVLKPGSKVTESELLEFCRARVAHYKAPRSVEFLESLPKTGSGKILKKDLCKKYWQGQETIRPEFAGFPGKTGVCLERAKPSVKHRTRRARERRFPNGSEFDR